jgi:hypothetical protein
MEWLQDRMRKLLAEGQSESNVFDLRPQLAQPEDPTLRAVALVERAVRHIQDTEREAAARHAHAETLARKAIEEVNKAQELARAAESARRKAEAQVQEVTARVQAMEFHLAAAEELARNAEKRAVEAEDALKRIESAIHGVFESKRLCSREADPIPLTANAA